MKNKVTKTIIKSIIIFIILILNISNSYGAQGSMYLGLRGNSTSRATGAYTFNNRPIFKIIKYNSSLNAAEDGTSIYCLKGGVGFGSDQDRTEVRQYTQYFDIKSPSSITPAAYRNQLPSNTTTYSQLVWVLDHIYTPAKNGANSTEIALANQSKQELLDNAGVDSSSFLRTASTSVFNDIVESIQQVAIWYFTNPSGDVYHNSNTDAVTIKVDGTDLIDKYDLDILDNEIDAIYSYLVNGAINAVRNGYKYENSTQNPLKINSSSVTATIEGNNYVIGPYKIEKNINSAYTINASITDGSNQITSAKILNQSKQEITTGSNISQKIQSTIGNNFYIAVPIESGIAKVKLQINGNANVTKQTLWTVGESSLSINQPVVIVERTSQDYTDSHEINTPQISGSYNLRIIKKDSSNSNNLQGAKFTVKINNGVAQEYTTNGSGEINIPTIQITGIGEDTITINETEAPLGYVPNLLSTTIKVTKSIQNGKYVATAVNGSNSNLITDASGVNTVNHIAYNTRLSGVYKLKLTKQDSETRDKLAGAKFNISINGGRAQEYTTNGDGEISIDNISIDSEGEDTIEIQETQAPSGYKLDSNKITLKVTKAVANNKYIAANVTGSENANLTQDETTGVNTINVAVNNEKISNSYNLKIIKKDSDDANKKLENAKFRITFYRQSTTESNEIEETSEYTTNSQGEINLSKAIVAGNLIGKIKVEEIEAPAGYEKLLNNEITLRFRTVEANNKYSITDITDINNNGNMTFNSETNTIELNVTNKRLQFDLALRKFITKINNKSVESREPQISNNEVSKLANGEATFDNGTTALKTHTKKPLTVETGDKVLYTIRIYNESKLDGYAKEITDYLPDGLELVPSSESTINSKYGWRADANNSKKITTNYLQNEVISKVTTARLSYRDVEIECKVVKEVGQNNVSLKNVAEITRAEDINGNTKDIDSTPNNLTDSQKNSYNPGTSERGKGYEDDDDYEELVLSKKNFDLALRKFITKINNKSVESREPQISNNEVSKLANGEATFDNGTTALKTHTKKPLTVETGDKVLYTIRIYNESKLDGYAKEITDYLPDGLELVPSSESTINSKYGWRADANNSKKITTNYLQNEVISKVTTARLSYRDVEIECKVVKEVGQNNVSLKNVAEITRAEDINGNTKDIDSTPNNLTDNQKNSYNPETSERGRGYEDDDDYEELIMLGKYFDLSLRKFITGVNDKNITNREPVVDVTPLLNGETTANYNHTKEPVEVDANDIVTYTIRVYNEGTVDGYVNRIVDHLPPELEFLKDDEINKQYGWKQINDRTVETEYLKNTQLKAFNMTGTLDYKDVKIRCRVKEVSELLKKITNIAEVTEYRNNPNIPDRDNKNNVELPKDEDLPDYKKEEIESGKDYIPGQEDDDDFEKVVLKKFDLALRKFITGVNSNEVTSRIPQVDTSKYGQKREDGTIITSFEYNHTKDPVRVSHNDIVTYTIRVYNEGTKSGYAQEIKDDIPDGLTFLLDNEINKQYRWKMYDKDGNETYDTAKATHIRTDYLSIQNENTKGENLLKAYNSQTMQEPDYKDVKVAFRVAEPNTSDRIIINKAEISEDADENGDDVPDIDSTPDEWNEGEDDQDIEKIYVQYFDLALRKWVTQVIVIEDGVEKVKETGHYAEQDPEPVVRVDLNQKRIDNTIIKFRYKIRIANEGEIPGYVTEISDYIPKGLSFNQADNPLWKEVDGKIVTDQLKDKLLNPGETATVEVTLTWINDEENMGVMTNVAEISKDKNESNTPDIDSTPNNKKEGEDDIDDAPVALTMVTGKAPTYIAITSGISVIIAGGVFLIKKYVI